jgi:hypothetical protein
MTRVTDIGSDHDHELPVAAWEQIRLRAAWLQDLPDRERDELFAVPLRVVDARFAEWLDARSSVRDDGGG